MDRREAKRLLEDCLADYRRLTYAELAALVGEVRAFAVTGGSGVEYQIEISAHWDDRPGGSVRLLACIDDGGWRAFVPLCADLLVSPGGEVVGGE